jgi:hypothetical protein
MLAETLAYRKSFRLRLHFKTRQQSLYVQVCERATLAVHMYKRSHLPIQHVPPCLCKHVRLAYSQIQTTINIKYVVYILCWVFEGFLLLRGK